MRGTNKRTELTCVEHEEWEDDGKISANFASRAIVFGFHSSEAGQFCLKEVR